jgi:hypothetical protein
MNRFELSPSEVMEDFLDSHPDKEDVMQFVGVDETPLSLEVLIAKYEDQIIERWSDVPYLRHCDEVYESKKI